MKRSQVTKRAVKKNDHFVAATIALIFPEPFKNDITELFQTVKHLYIIILKSWNHHICDFNVTFHYIVEFI